MRRRQCVGCEGEAVMRQSENGRKVPQATARVRAGMGAAILPSWIADRDPNLVCLLPPEKVTTVELWLVTHRDLLRTAHVRPVVDFLADLCGEMVTLYPDGIAAGPKTSRVTRYGTPAARLPK